MTISRPAFLFIFLFAGAGLSGGAQDADSESSFLEPLTRLISPEFRRGEARLDQINKELESLPGLRPEPFASRYGFRSRTLVDQHQPQWLQIDLLRSQSIDRIAAMPVNIPASENRGAGYGFPLQFRIEVSDDPEMASAVTIADQTTEDFPNPGAYPLNFHTDGIKGRYVRFTSLKHFRADEGYMWGLEELLILSGNRNIACQKPVIATSSLNLFPNWSESRIQDGQSALNMPVTAEPSPTRGYRSSESDDTRTKKWLVVDLGREYPIDEIRLLPVEPAGFGHPGLLSFPRAYKILFSKDRDFTDITWTHTAQRNNLVGYPGSCAVILPTEGNVARFVRFETVEMWGEGDRHAYALSEIQAYSGNTNVALGKTVTASDSNESTPWSTATLVDGFTSHHKIVELPDYLDLIERRGNLESEARQLVEKKQNKLRRTENLVTYGGGGLGLFLVLGSGWLFVRQRSIRVKAVKKLREQIARDLHDDIGSNLGGIVLLSELGSNHSAEPQSREDFRLIKAAADEASASMRDIVWLVQSGHTGLRDLVTKMRESAQMILGDKVISMKTEPATLRDRQLSLFFRRHVFLSYKETLNNLRKHAGASKADITIRVESRNLVFIVQDNGIGFDPKLAFTPDHGLANLKRRAQRMHGSVIIHGILGKGTTVTFTAPLKS